jgi:hypothetical protein
VEKTHGKRQWVNIFLFRNGKLHIGDPDGINEKLKAATEPEEKERFALSAEIQALKTQVKEQNERISNLSRLIVHLVKIQGKDLPPEVVLSIIAPMQEVN